MFQMGYAKPDQKGQGIHTRQFARSYIVDDGKSRIVFVTTDCGMMGTFLRKEVTFKAFLIFTVLMYILKYLTIFFYIKTSTYVTCF